MVLLYVVEECCDNDDGGDNDEGGVTGRSNHRQPQARLEWRHAVCINWRLYMCC